MGYVMRVSVFHLQPELQPELRYDLVKVACSGCVLSNHGVHQIEQTLYLAAPPHEQTAYNKL